MSDEKKSDLNVPACELPMEEHPSDFRHSFHWRIFRIMAEFVDGFQFLADFRKTISFFGSARTPEGSRWYEEARKLGRLLAEAGYTVVTGGGPGIMQAGNQGAVEGNGTSLGLNIKLPHEQRINPYVRKGVGFHYFFVRKVMLSYAAQTYVYFPGGYGTLDEMFELLVLVQTHKIPVRIPVILVGKEFWEPVTKWIEEVMYKKFQAIDQQDMNLYYLVDTAEEALEIIKKSPERSEFAETTVQNKNT